MSARFDSAIPVLRSGDYARSKAFFAERLGFRVVVEGGDPPGFGIFVRGRAQIFVDAWRGADPSPHEGWRAYFHVDDADAAAAELRAAGIPIAEGPHDAGYGLREVEFDDPDGNRLCFGQILDGGGG